MKRKFSLLINILSLFFWIPTAVGAEHGKQILITGWLESVVLSPWQIRLRAKLDTGAKTSSIHAEKIERFERDGDEWVKFTLPSGKKKGAEHRIEVPLLRNTSIKRHNLPAVIRPVVELAFCIDGHYYKTEFTLADRSNFNYPVLLGRRFLQNNIMVDSSSVFMHSDKHKEGACNDPATKLQHKKP